MQCMGSRGSHHQAILALGGGPSLFHSSYTWPSCGAVHPAACASALRGGAIAGRRGHHLGKTASADSSSEPAGPHALELQVDEQASSAPCQPLFLVELRPPGVRRAGSLVFGCRWLEQHQPTSQLLQCGTRLLSWRLWKGAYLSRTQVDRGPS